MLYNYRPAGAKDTIPPKPLKIRVLRVLRDNPRFRREYKHVALTGLRRWGSAFL